MTAKLLLKQGAAADVPTPDTAKSAAFVDSADLTLKLRDASGVLLSPARWGGVAISPAQLVANTNDWAPTGYATCGRIRFSTDASRDITGIVALTDGVRLRLQNIGAQNAVLKHQSASSAAANRFYGPNSADVTVRPNGSVDLEYDLASTGWRVLGP